MARFLLIDKPTGITSHDVISRLRRITGIKKIGHGGTLDPNASGLLIVGIGRDATRLLGTIAKNTTKTYIAEVTLGEARNTDDAEGEVTDTNTKTKPFRKQVDICMTSFLGESLQVPPVFSALKIGGKTAYSLARKGKTVELSPRKIRVGSIIIIFYKYPLLKFSCRVSSGTYVRALARDIGNKLGTYAYLSGLRRITIGEYDIASAVKLEELTADNWEASTTDLQLP
ncbi:tRNA pseudouridine(55) synthase TruB [Candidatus Woesebacteria bacterium RIFCSPHIGHO2_01_FULL_41_10]|uniref:tRNA pseudouridine synthase B n=1 Tax=Candidatus Woesebacteria bacterium RIFCSPHIGHO2_01_FULL_41_10 TaxID=1802500 RepID=A0A1F7YN82_9BACT|nr:MAG: tRNA pseudouridine(55) synthase TruB [Candidatus Woesebacteria bacterium RIFCSPHIGHO2_01_FULL_41_10]